MQKAFTLIELLVVVLIIGILSSIALPQYQKAVERARTAEIFQNMGTLERGIDIYLLENGYPASGTIQFLGDSPNVRLPVDITAGMNCSDEYCSTSHFIYSAYCNSSYCYAVGCRLKHGDTECDNAPYELNIRKDNGATVWYKQCEDGRTAIANAVCSAASALGFDWRSC